MQQSQLGRLRIIFATDGLLGFRIEADQVRLAAAHAQRTL